MPIPSKYSTLVRRFSGRGDLTYAYLVSAPHSGSTLVACLLACHPAISTVGEFGAKVSSVGRCSCGQTYRECPFWRLWASRAQKQGIDFDIHDLGINLEPRTHGGHWESLFYYLFPWKGIDRLRDVAFALGSAYPGIASRAIDKAVKLARDLCQAQGTAVFLDTMKNPLQLRFLSAHPGIRLRTIALLRDGRGVTNSLIKREQYSAEKAVSTWLWSSRNVNRAVRHYFRPDDVFWLKLEDLCRDPSQVLAALCSFLDVEGDFRVKCLDRTKRHIIGNSMRHVFDGEIRHDESWKHELSAEALALFETRAGWLNRRYGYQA